MCGQKKKIVIVALFFSKRAPSWAETRCLYKQKKLNGVVISYITIAFNMNGVVLSYFAIDD